MFMLASKFSHESSIDTMTQEGDDAKYRIIRKSVAFVTDDRVHSYELKVEKPGVYKMAMFRKRSGNDTNWWDYARNAVETCNVTCYGLSGVEDATVLCTLTRPRQGRARYILVYAHGNTWDLGTLHRPFRTGLKATGEASSVDDCMGVQDKRGRRSLLQIMADKLGCVVVAFEYPGYGERYSETSWPQNRKDHTINGDVNSLERAPRYMARVIEWACEKNAGLSCVVMGYSVGAAVTVECIKILQDRDIGQRIKCAVLMSSFWSLKGVVGNGIYEQVGLAGLKALGLLDAYDISRVIGSIHVPTIYVHGQRDDVCPTQGAYNMLYSRQPHAHSFNILGEARRRVGAKRVKVWGNHRDVLLHPSLYRVINRQVGEIFGGGALKTGVENKRA